MTLSRHKPVLPDNDELEKLLEAAGLAADAASLITLRYFRAAFDVQNKAQAGAFDPVTVADKQAELAIRELLLKHFPEIGFYGEEHESVAGTSGLMWVVDPIDGTRAFMSGMPLWGTLIGLYNGQDAILGLMDQPFLNERFVAISHTSQLLTPSGARTLTTRSVPDLSSAVAYCTTPDMFVDAASKACFERIRSESLLMRYGGDCYAYALLAAGHVDVVLDCDLKPYDILALIPIIRAAGGVVTTWEGDSAVDGGYIVACGSEALHSKVLPLLQRRGVEG